MSAASRFARSVVRSADAGLPKHRGRTPQHPDAGGLHVPQRRARLVADSIGEPFEVLDHPNEGAAARGQPDRPEVRAEEVLPQGQHRLHHFVTGGLALESVRQRGHRVGRMPAQLSVVTWRQQEQRGGHAHRERDRPTHQTLVDRAGWRARGQHEGQQRGPLAGRDRLAEHTREHDRHAEHEHQHNGEPRVRRHQGAQRDQDRAVDAQPRVGHGAGLAVAGEVRQHQQREGPEEREQRRLGIAGDGEAQRGRQRDDDRRAQRAPQRVELGIAFANPTDRPAHQAGRRVSHLWERKRIDRCRARR